MQRTSAEAGAAPTATRLRSMDTLRACLVAWVIAGHALLGYSRLGGWVYDQVAEVRFKPGVEPVLIALIGPTGMFLMGAFFLIAGLFEPASLARTGPVVFLRRRLLRLGIPFLATVVLIWPATVWLAYRSTGRSRTYLSMVTGRGFLHAGALWFVEVLLIFSVGYLLWSLVFGQPRRDIELRGKHLVLLAAGIATASFILRLWLTARASEPSDLHLWQWPQLAGLFALGVAGGHRMAGHLPGRLVRACGLTALGVVVAMPVVAVLAGVHGVQDSGRYLGGWHWQAAFFAIAEATLVVSGSVWLVGFAQRHFEGPGPAWVPRATRASYAAFVLQNPVLVAVAVSLRPLSAPAEVKAPIVAVAGVALCFLLGHLAVTKTPLRKLL